MRCPTRQASAEPDVAVSTPVVQERCHDVVRGVEGEVHVGVDEPGQHRDVAEVEGVRDRVVVVRPDGSDAAPSMTRMPGRVPPVAAWMRVARSAGTGTPVPRTTGWRKP